MAYSMLTKVVDLISAENGKPINTIVDEAMSSGNSINYFNNNYLRKYIKFTKECRPNERNCSIFKVGAYNTIKPIGGEHINKSVFRADVMWEYALPNGMFLGINDYGGKNLPFVVDLNGSKGPNQIGYDIFYFAIFTTETDMRKDNALVCFNSSNYTPNYFWVRSCNKNDNNTGGANCSCSIIDNGFKIPDNYPVKF